MLNKRILIIANSVYQLLTAIHMRKSILAGRAADLIVTDITPKLKEASQRLKQTGLFDRVIFATTKDLNRKYATGSMETLSEGFGTVASILRWTLNEELADYSAIYFSNFDVFTRMLACWYDQKPCEFICYEDGFSTYVIDYLREDRAAINRHPQGGKIRNKVSKVLLYEPRLAMRKDRLENCALPKIDRHNEELRALFNYVFDYRTPERNADFIFLEQSFLAEGIKSNDQELIRECQQTVGAGRFVVKPHPRNPQNIAFLMGLSRKYPSDAPWELFLMNEDPQHTTILTVCSNAALTGSIVFGVDMNTVMLYRLYQGKVLWKEDEKLKQYLYKFQKQFSGKNYYVPQTVYELRNILKFLGGRNEG